MKRTPCKTPVALSAVAAPGAHAARMIDRMDGKTRLKIMASLLEVTLPPHGFLVLVPELNLGGGYSAYKRVQ